VTASSAYGGHVSVTECQACGRRGTFRPHFADPPIERCTACGLLTADVGAIDAARLYGRDYFVGGEYRHYEEDAAELAANFARDLRQVRALAQGTKLLELGAAYGYFLEAARAAFPVCVGIDVSEDAAASARARGLDVVAADVLTMPPPPQAPFDVVCMWDTIEHLQRPGDTVMRLAGWLRPGGTLFLSTGDAGSLVARVRGRRWRQIHPPTHVHYFDRGSLEALAARAGLSPVAWRHPPFTRSYRSMADAVFARRGPLGRAACRALTLGGALDFPVRLNLFDLCFFAARKP
jgi:SAM-dependent methyltransferase